MRWLGQLFAAAALLVSTGAALADKRVALVIGNSAYRNVAKLANPLPDAIAVANLFRMAGFDAVDLRQDLDATDLRRALREFALRARDADIAVVFYAGHGIEVNGTNYLVPINAELAQDIDVEDETISLDRVLATTEAARRLRLVILDACRDNPFVPKMAHTIASRSVGRGLARVEPLTTDTLVAFAAKAGSLASDGESAHSPFTAALLKHLTTPGLDVRIAFGRVRDEVLASTKGQQEPFVYGSLGGSDLPLVPAAAGADAALSPPAPPTSLILEERTDYELADKVGTVEAWDWFLRQHTQGFYHDLAKAQRAKLAAAHPEPEPPKPRPETPVTPAASPPPQVAIAPAPLPGPPAKPPVTSNAVPDNTILRDATLLREVRDRLYELNFDPGSEDGRSMQSAIRQYQVANHLPEDGQPTEGLLRRLREAQQPSPWGAIVYSTRAQWGMSWGHSTRKQAVDSAHTSCGGAQCSAELSFAGSECGAFASSGSGWALVARSGVDAAREAALSECAKRGKACRVVAAVCADGSGRFKAAN
jgi:Caspase domain/Domain of unknown function (DUF4189)